MFDVPLSTATTFKITLNETRSLRSSFVLVITKNRRPSALVLVNFDCVLEAEPPLSLYYDVISGETSVTVDGKQISVDVGGWGKVTVISTYPQYNSYFSFSVA